MSKRGESSLVENIKTIVYAGLIAIGIRTVAFEPFNIPSSSMVPTLLVGDYLFVSKYSYGYSIHSLPMSPQLFHGRIFGKLPERGDVAVFKLPKDNSTDYIKRIIGLPGDHIQVKSGQLYINDKLVPREAVGNYVAEEGMSRTVAKRFIETLPNGKTHDILKMNDGPLQISADLDMNNTSEYVVPEGHVFAMGDNRDNSLDSRVQSDVGYVPLENLVGRAEFIWFSIDAHEPFWAFWAWPTEIRWSRIFMGIN